MSELPCNIIEEWAEDGISITGHHLVTVFWARCDDGTLWRGEKSHHYPYAFSGWQRYVLPDIDGGLPYFPPPIDDESEPSP